MKCKICGAESKLALSHKVRNAYEAHYRLCPDCDFMFVANPTWLDEAYSKPINTTDVGYVMRNIYLSKKTLVLFMLIFKKTDTFLDYASGYGILPRIMRDYGLDFLWDDIYVKNLFMEKFEYSERRDAKIKALTCFECFEHLPEPFVEIEKMLKITDTIFFSTMLKPVGICPSPDWIYYGFNHGQHVAFYSTKTLEFIAKKYGLNFYTDGTNIHLLTKKKLPASILKWVNVIVKLQLDILFRKCLTSKTSQDQRDLMAKGF